MNDLELEMFIDLKPYLNPAPYVVSADTSLHKARGYGCGHGCETLHVRASRR